MAAHGEAHAKVILDDIDKRYAFATLSKVFLVVIYYSIAAVPLFANLRRFPEGRGFKQWTGDDSKALMKV